MNRRIVLAAAIVLGGAVTVAVAVASRDAEAKIEGAEEVPLDDVDLSEAYSIRADGEGGLWIFTGSTAHHAAGEQIHQIDQVEDLPTNPVRLAPCPDGALVVSHGSGGERVTVVGAADRRDVDVGLGVGALTCTDDGTVVVGTTEARNIWAYPPSGPPQALLGYSPDTTDPAEIGDVPGDMVADVAVLSDDRVVFATDDLQRSLFLLDDGEPRPITVTFPGGGARNLRDVTATPDGRILAVATRTRSDGSAPVVALVDPDSGEARAIADLTDVADGDAFVSAAAVGDDVVVLAGERLWRIPGAVG